MRAARRRTCLSLKLWRAVAVLGAAALTGCAVGPNYQRPEVTTIPPAYAGATDEWKVATPQAHLAKRNWWKVFGDEELNRLIADAVFSNFQLQATAARFEQARAAAGVAGSGLYPHVGGSASAMEQRDSENRPVGGKAGETYSNFVVPFDLGYVFDLWGRARRRVEAAKAQEEAAAADVEAVKLTVQAEVAADYFTIRMLDSEKVLLTTSVEAYRKALELTRNRRAAGIVSDLDVAQAETVLRTAEAQVTGTVLQRARFEDALAVLTGNNASLFSVEERPLTVEPPVIPPGVPSELLERRPDVAAAERRMAGANANIGVAKAAFFPSIQLVGVAGFQSGDLGTLFDWPSRLWAVGPSLNIPLFDGGKLRSDLRGAQAGYLETVARYRQTVLVAFAEVESNLAAQRLLALEDEQAAAAAQAARWQLEVAENRYRVGMTTYLAVAIAQVAALERERSALRLRSERLVATVALVKSLGGGWEGLGEIRKDVQP